MVNSMAATRVGVHRIKVTYDELNHVPCARCGRDRTVRAERKRGDLCQDCISTDRHCFDPTRWGTP
jgi:hypothetical protein